MSFCFNLFSQSLSPVTDSNNVLVPDIHTSITAEEVFRSRGRLTRLLQVTGFGPGLSVLRAVALMWVIPAGEDHEPFVREPQLDVAVEVGAAPQGVTERRLPATQGLCCQLRTFLPPQSVHFLNPLGTLGKSSTAFKHKVHKLRQGYFLKPSLSVRIQKSSYLGE